jgi:predicted transcriptional regulator of viral defense system
MPTFCHALTPSLRSLGELAERLPVIRSSELKKYGIHRQVLKRAVDRGLLRKMDCGLYTATGFPSDLERRIVLACKRVSDGVVCLESALQFHGLSPSESDTIWMAIDRKARKPAVKRLRLRFVRFSNEALTQGIVNARIDGVPVRIYSSAKTIADCL